MLLKICYNNHYYLQHHADMVNLHRQSLNTLKKHLKSHIMAFRKFMRPNATIQGGKKTYIAWEFREGHLQMLAPQDMVCITCRLVLPKRYVFTYIGYHKNVAEFLETNTLNSIAYSYFFIPAEDPKAAYKIIRDIIRVHPELKQK